MTSSAPASTVPTTGPNVRPGEKPPTLPAAGRTDTNLGQIEFATYWMQSLDWAYATTSSTLARSVFSTSCVSCARLLAFDIDEVRRDDRHYVGGRIGVVSTEIVPNEPHFGSTAIVDLTAQQTAFELVGRAGHVFERTPQSRNSFRVWLARAGGTWTVVDWKTVNQR